MEIKERDSRFFGTFGLILVVIGLLVPYLLQGISSNEAIGGFLITSMLLGVIFSIMGHKSKPGLVGLIIGGCATVLLLILILLKVG